MRPRLPWLLLAVSMAFNAFFAFGYLQGEAHAGQRRSFRDRARAMARQLDLDDRQLQAFEQILEGYERLREARAPQREAFWAELVKDRPDEKLLDDYMAGEPARRDRLAKLALIQKMIALLSPQQREKLVQLVKKRSPPPK